MYDPCEKEAYDVTATLTNQQREDITALAQVISSAYMSSESDVILVFVAVISFLS